MKTGIHPEYMVAKVTCACGRVTETRATVPELHVDICSHCHPFFTGRQKLVDTAGRVERFRTKYGSLGSEPTEDSAEPGDAESAAAVEAETESVPEADVAVELEAAEEVEAAAEAAVETEAVIEAEAAVEASTADAADGSGAESSPEEATAEETEEKPE